MLYCYELDTVRSSFIQQIQISELQLKVAQDEEHSDISQELLCIDGSCIDGITPTFIKQFKSKPIYFHGFENILAICCTDGNIKLYSLITNQLIFIYNYKVGIPMCCFIHQQVNQNQIQIFCEIGYQTGEVVSLNVNKQSSQKFRFWKRKFNAQTDSPMDNIPNNTQTDEIVQENEANKDLYSKQQVKQLQLQQNKNINQIFALLETVEYPEADNDDDDENKLQIFSKNDLDRITFSCIKALWMDDKYIAVADENYVSYFIKQYVLGTHQGYMLLNSYQFEQIPTRYQFKLFNETLMFYGILCSGNVLRLKIVDNQWMQQIVE
ncbi:Conserved_hypothetical protein [Hexamita inflata]|uniref:Uncharacterized protein n=1 Tax=Hexamita inflata TaxID=28002 RepID=A0ABP1HIA6_9EUKA